MTRRPVVRRLSMRTLVQVHAGPEKGYPAYRFSGKSFIERKGHNPFVGLGPVVIETYTLQDAEQSVPYAAALVATGGAASFVWTLEAGSYPPGLTMSSVGIVGGTPSTPGSYEFSVRAADSVISENYDIAVISIVVI